MKPQRDNELMMATPVEVQTQAKILADYKIKHEALLKERSVLEYRRLEVNTRAGSLTKVEQDELANINHRMDQISAAIAELVREETKTIPDTELIAKQAAKQELFVKVQASIPPPPSGSYTIAHSAIAAGDVISYLKFTQYLNPYGRKRQCDTDLENLMSVIGKDVSNGLGELQKLITDILKATK